MLETAMWAVAYFMAGGAVGLLAQACVWDVDRLSVRLSMMAFWPIWLFAMAIIYLTGYVPRPWRQKRDA